VPNTYLYLDDSDLSFGNTLIFTENDVLSQKIATHIKYSAISPTKVMVVDIAPPIKSLSSLLQDPLWENDNIMRIF
jgi:hypothetical protein